MTSPASEMLGELVEALDAAGRSGAFRAFYRPGDAAYPYPEYLEPMDRLWDAFAAAGFTPEPADYRSWLEAQPAPFDPESIAAIGRGDLMMLLLAVRRSERFGDGSWIGMLERGVFLAIARRLLALADQT